MPAGFQSWSSAGTIQITDSRKNPVMVASGNGTTVTNTVSGAPLAASMLEISYTLPSSAHYPMLAIRPTGVMVFYGVGSSGLTRTWTFLSTQAVGTSVPYWIFDRKDTLTASGLFEVYDSSGTLAFSLAEKPLRIRDVIGGVMGPSLWTSVHTYESGRTYAAMVARWSEEAVYRALPDETQVYGLGVRGSTDGITLSAVNLYDVPGDATPSPFTAKQVIVLDVTNY